MADKIPDRIPYPATSGSRSPFRQEAVPKPTKASESITFESVDRELMEAVIKTATIRMNLTVPAKFNPRQQPGFFVFSHRMNEGFDRIDMPHEQDLAKMKITESLAVLPSEAAVYETEMVTEQRAVSKPALWGLMQKQEVQSVQVPKQKFVRMRPKLFSEYVPNGAAEPAYRFIYQAQDDAGDILYREPYQGGARRAQLSCNIVLPESIALKLLERIRNEPEIIGRIFQIAAERHFGMPQDAYERGTPDTDGKPLGPPYAAWRAKDGGSSRFYLLDLSKVDAVSRKRLKTETLDPQRIIEH